MLSFLFKPRPYPAFVLLAIILVLVGLKFLSMSHIVGAGFFVAAAVVLISFIRGVTIDLAVNKDGVITNGRVTNVERKSGKSKGERYEVVWIHFTFTDTQGAMHEQTMVLDASEKSDYAVGSSVKIRYHPRYPDMWRWLE
jgi:uncharacterized protein DUF3592